MADYVFKAVTDFSKTLSLHKAMLRPAYARKTSEFLCLLAPKGSEKEEKKNPPARAKRTVSAPTLGSEEWCGCRR